MRSLLLLFLGFFVVASPAFAGESPVDACARLAAHEYEDGHPPGVAIENIDVATALPACRAAHSADPASLPTIYRLGRVLQANSKFIESTRLYGEAAAGGYAMAEVAYSRALLQGRGIPPDPVASFHWMERAANQGHPVAQMDASERYQYGIGVGYDLDKAIALLKAAAAQNESEAERRLGDIHFFDEYGRTDYAAAASHYLRAVELGSAVAEFNYGQLLQCDCDLRDIDASLLRFESAASKGVPVAMRHLGYAYLYGQGVEADDAQALRHFREAYAAGDPTSAYYIGLFYSWGREVAKDDEQTAKWWREAALAGMPQAQYELGRLFLTTPGPEGRRADGIHWLERAGQAGVIDAYWMLFAHFTSIPVNDLDRAYTYGQLVSTWSDPQIAEQGQSMMKTILRLKRERGLEPRPPAAESGRG